MTKADHPRPLFRGFLVQIVWKDSGPGELGEERGRVQLNWTPDTEPQSRTLSAAAPEPVHRFVPLGLLTPNILDQVQSNRCTFGGFSFSCSVRSRLLVRLVHKGEHSQKQMPWERKQKQITGFVSLAYLRFNQSYFSAVKYYFLTKSTQLWGFTSVLQQQFFSKTQINTTVLFMSSSLLSFSVLNFLQIKLFSDVIMCFVNRARGLRLMVAFGVRATAQICFTSSKTTYILSSGETDLDLCSRLECGSTVYFLGRTPLYKASS